MRTEIEVREQIVKLKRFCSDSDAPVKFSTLIKQLEWVLSDGVEGVL